MRVRSQGRVFALSIAVVMTGHACAQTSGSEDDDLATRIDQAMSRSVIQGVVPGCSIGVMIGGETVIAKGYGFSNLEHDVRASADTVYRIGSITKQFAAASILQLDDADKLDVQDNIIECLPYYTAEARNFTIHHLLTHTSGVPNYTTFGEEYERTTRLSLSNRERMGLFFDKPLLFEPGERRVYSNSGYLLLGMVVEHLSGATWGEYLEKNIFAPLGMTRSMYWDERAIVPGRAAGYERAGHAFANEEYLDSSVPGGAGAVCSTVNDLLAWQQALHGGRVISEKNYDLMTTPAVLNDGSATIYGYGLGVYEWKEQRKISHPGGIQGFSSDMSYYPDHDLFIVVLANSAGQMPTWIERRIAGMCLDLDMPWPDDLPISGDECETLTGTYRFEALGDIEIYCEGDELYMRDDDDQVDRMIRQADGSYLLQYDLSIRCTFEENTEGDQALSIRFNARLVFQGNAVTD